MLRQFWAFHVIREVPSSPGAEEGKQEAAA